MKSTIYVIPFLLAILPYVLPVEDEVGFVDKLIINTPDRFFSCKLNVDELPPNQPLYVNSKTKDIIFPTVRQNKIVLYTGSHTIGLAYPKEGNLILSKYSCTRERLFKNGLKKHHPRSLTINESLPVYVQNRGLMCPFEMIWLTPGFLLDEVFSPVFSNCYNETAHFPIDATYRMDGRVVSDEDVSWTLDKEIKGGGEEEKIQQQFYEKRHQQVMVVKNYGMAAALQVFRKREEYLVPLRLVPAKDLVLPSLGTAASAFSNIIPIWSSNGPIWVQAENYVRKVAKQLKKKILVHTSTRDYVTVTTSSGDEEVLIESTPIPKYISKIVRDMNECFVLVMANDVQAEELKCKNQCRTGLPSNICCSSYQDFKEKYPLLIPVVLECKTLLDTEKFNF